MQFDLIDAIARYPEEFSCLVDAATALAMKFGMQINPNVVSSHEDSTTGPVNEPNGNYTAHLHEAIVFHGDSLEVPPPDQESLLRSIQHEAAKYQAALAKFAESQSNSIVGPSSANAIANTDGQGTSTGLNH